MKATVRLHYHTKFGEDLLLISRFLAPHGENLTGVVRWMLACSGR